MKTLALILIALLGQASLANAAFEEKLATEARLIKEYPQVSRSSGTLRIETPERAVEFKDNTSNGEAASNSFLIAVDRIGKNQLDYVVVTQLYEGHDFTLINGESGAKVSLPGQPKLSPERRYYLSSSIDLEAGEMPNELKIIRASDFSVELRKQYQMGGGKAAGPQKARWLNEQQIEVIEQRMVVKNNIPAFSLHKVLFEKRGRVWVERTEQ